MIPLLSEDRVGSLRIWDHPRDNFEYVIGVDTAEGRVKDRSAADRRKQFSYSDNRPDYSAAVVLEMESSMHVATWHGYMTPDEFATVCAAIGWYYNTALVVPEINGPGLVVVTRLAETFQYNNLYRTRMFNVMERDPWQPQWGWRTDMHSRKLLIARIHEALNGGHLFTRDRHLIDELRTLEFDDQGVERGKGKNKDDRVLALGMALQGRYEALGGISERKPPRPPARAYEDRIWNIVKQQQEPHDSRSSSSSGRFLDRGPPL
jgi:hypothetical protein